MGNGPSLKKDINGKLDQLASKTVFVVNLFCKSEMYDVLKPSYYILADKALWDNKGLKEASRVEVKRFMEILNEKTTWPMKILIPVEGYKKYRDYYRNNSSIEVIQYNKTAIDGFDFFKNWTYRNNLSMPAAQTVLNAAVFLAINLGFKEINLLGADHSWHKNLYLREDNVLCLIDDHFYDKDKPAPTLINVNYSYEKTPKVHDELYSAGRALESHHKLKNYADSRNVTVFNCSSTTFIDAYERKPFTIE